MKITQENILKKAITTRFVLENNSNIVSVFYDEDGDWQFFGNEEVTEEDARIVSIQHILDIDNSLTTLPEILRGQSAFRNDKNSAWKIEN
ncbi:hypothetical protein FIA56_11995 [Testudinibacter sp. TR-2022]|nr:hypothetical protein [Testudinibacter sp. TR-2022]TNH03600.1 hypothetical protein FHQ22_07700 [Pasteurellaceae bacterium Phil31]TNH10744.1 hypothetical protein FIA56_11995 [Testudinibacter sp. TR-2022]TNH13472.1 hypothetical protein FHQ23_11970 [Testudinibacter sp. TR-2022]